MAMDGFVRATPWVTLVGVVAMVAGLTRDARLHRLDPGLAAREGVFTLGTTAHGLFALGLALAVAGTMMFLVSVAGRAGRVSLRVVTALALVILALMSLNLFAVAVAGSGHDGHAHGAAVQGAAGSHMHSSGPMPSGPPTAEQRAAADELLLQVKTSLRRFQDLAAAQAAGYRQTTPWFFRTWGPAHFNNRALNGDDGLLDPDRPEALVYMRMPDGRTVLLGAMFIAPKGTGPRPGGVLTTWHVHDNLCVTATGSVALAREPGACPPGSFFIGDAAEMMHVWVFAHPEGAFAHTLSGEAIRAALAQFSRPR